MSQIPNVAYGSRYTSGSDLGFEPIREICQLSVAERVRIVRAGELAGSVLQKSCRILAEAFQNNDPDLEWLRRITMASIPEEYRGFAKSVMIMNGEKSPVNFRLDMLGDGTIAEIQCPGSGWGYTIALEELLGISPDNSSILQTYRSWIGDRTAVWWLYNESLSRSVAFLAEQCKKNGIRLEVKRNNEFNPDGDFQVVVKRPPFPELVSGEQGRALLKRWMDGKIEMDPAPSMVSDTKFQLVMLHHPSTRDSFTEEERKLCHPSYIIEESKQELNFGGPVVRIADLPNLSKGQRKFIIKYGGGRRWDRFGGHEVHSLRHKDRVEERFSLIERAIREYQETDEGWIIQPFISGKRTFASLGLSQNGAGNKSYYILWRPAYQMRGGKVSHIGTTILNLRENWKVHGSSDTYFGLAR